MSNMDIDQVLATMRVMAAQAENRTEAAQPAQEGGSFGDLLKQSVDKVNETQQASKALATAFETGEGNADLAQVMMKHGVHKCWKRVRCITIIASIHKLC